MALRPSCHLRRSDLITGATTFLPGGFAQMYTMEEKLDTVMETLRGVASKVEALAAEKAVTAQLLTPAQSRRLSEGETR